MCSNYEIILPDRKKFVQDHHLCMKCLSRGNFLRTCHKVDFGCQEKGCMKEHHTLLHPLEAVGEKNGKQDDEVCLDPKVMDKNNSQNKSRLTATNGAGERVCLSV